MLLVAKQPRRRPYQKISSDDFELDCPPRKKSASVVTVGQYIVKTDGRDFSLPVTDKLLYCAADPRDAKRTIKHCQPLNSLQYQHLIKLLQRFEEPTKNPELLKIKNQILPESLELIQGPGGLRWAFWTPAAGPNLHDYVQKHGPLSEDKARRVFSQMVHIMTLCHSLNIMIRDLKLRKLTFDNEACTTIRLTSIDELTPLDLEDSDILKNRFGCPAYAAPELLGTDFQSYSGKAADIWSLGVLLFVMLFGRYPFFAPTASDLFSKIKTAPIQLSPKEHCKIGVQTKSLLWCLMRKEPSERPTAEQLLTLCRLQSDPGQKVFKTDDLMIVVT